jgi:Fe-S cluster biogenesis protein NfuA
MSEIKITIEGTPNPHALKFVLDRQVQLTGSSTYVTAEEAQGIPMASKLMALPGVETVFFMDSFVTVSKDAATPWQPLTDNVERVIRESIDQHDPAIIPQKVTPQSTSSDVKLMQIEEVIDRDIRPGLAMDGGGLVIVGLEGNVLQVSYQGACGSCPSSATGTLMAIQDLLRRTVDPSLEVVAAPPGGGPAGGPQTSPFKSLFRNV